uniref:hypothetical protein n=1 Tax=Klebsiella aerogenes TaxID=548 RepID=UPI0019534F6F
TALSSIALAMGSVTIKFNLFWAFIYNVTLIPVAAGAFAWAGITLRPELAAAAMALSSITLE